MEQIESLNQLSEFALLLKEAKAEKIRLAKEKQDEEIRRKETEVVPLLKDLFSFISNEKKAKILEEIPKKVVPVLVISPKPVVESFPPEPLVKKIPVPVVEPIPAVVPVIPVDSALEKSLTLKFKKLQEEFAFLKKFVSTQSSKTIQTTHSGGGEVKILRMDDIDLSNLQDGNVMTYSSSLNKIVFNTPTNGTDEEMPYAKRVDFITDNELYKGEASVGSSESNPVWRIHKIVIGNDSDVTETWADGVSTYNKVWDQRLTYTYL